MFRAFYDPGYYYRLPEGHSFPMGKFARASEIISTGSTDISVAPIPSFPEEVLREVHHESYLRKLISGSLDEDEIYRMGLPWRGELFQRSFLEVRGTLAAADAAIDDGLGFNLAGGTHHAFPDRAQGFCVLNDVAVAIHSIWRSFPDWRILILDTDAHQGNANHYIFRDHPLVYTFSIHVARNFPTVKEPGCLDVGLERWVDGDTYLTALRQALDRIHGEFHPHLIFWVTGVDVHECDRFGQMKLTTEDMSLRNRMVAEWCLDMDVPTTVVYGGGYHQEPEMTAQLHAMTTQEIAAIFSGTIRG